MQFIDHNIQQAREILEAWLTQNNYRKTPERFMVLEQVYRSVGHPDADEIFEALKERSIGVSRATVYNTLDILVDCGLILRHKFDNNTSRFEKSLGKKQHDHLICRKCGKVTEFCDPRIQHIQNAVGETLGFKITYHSLLLYGKCSSGDCKDNKS